MTTEVKSRTGPDQDWQTWWTLDDDGQFVTFGELTLRRKEDAIRQITQQLGETEPQPRALIRKIVQRLGVTIPLELLEETLEIEVNGGMMLPDGSRRRSPGGVFFRLIKDRYPTETRSIWYTPQPKKPKGPATTPKKSKEPKTKQEKASKSTREKGTSVKLTLIGRPSSRVVDKDTYMLMVFQVNKVPSLPKGLPAPDSQKTNYVVAVATKQWKQVASALDDEEDVFIIEGYPTLNKSGGIAVFTQSITTKKIQAAKRATMSEKAPSHV